MQKIAGAPEKSRGNKSKIFIICIQTKLLILLYNQWLPLHEDIISLGRVKETFHWV